jgi:hypothetical protein
MLFKLAYLLSACCAYMSVTSVLLLTFAQFAGAYLLLTPCLEAF